ITRGGGFGTNVYHVTTIGDSGPGSLRDGVTSTNAGTIVFDISGTINLLTPLYITNSFLTIAGQTAPDGGITIAGATTYIQDASDIILRYLRFRPVASSSVVWANSFEISGNNNNTFYAVTNFAGGWSLDSGSIDVVFGGPPFNPNVYEGSYFIDLNGDGPGV